MIELDRLRFPSGVAVASIIRSGSTGGGKAKILAVGFAVSAVWRMIQHYGYIPEEASFAFGVLPDYLSPVLYLSLMNFAAGLLAGRGGLPFFVGGVVAWWFLSPISVGMGWVPVPIEEAQAYLQKNMFYPTGIGMMIGGALMGIVMAAPAIKSAFKALGSATRRGADGGSDELSIGVLKLGLGMALGVFFVGAYMVPGVSFFEAIMAAVIGVLWLGVAALIVAQATGMTDISPMSGMALVSVTLMMFLLDGNIAGAMVVGVAVCVAIGQGADMMQDLKTGHMIGSRPIAQQAVQFGVTWIGAIVAIGVVYLLWQGGPNGEGGFGQGTALPAAQGEVLATVLTAVRSGTVPWADYGLGAGLRFAFRGCTGIWFGSFNWFGYVLTFFDYFGLWLRLFGANGD